MWQKFRKKLIINKRKQTGQDRQADCTENVSFGYSHVGDPTSSLFFLYKWDRRPLSENKPS